MRYYAIFLYTENKHEYIILLKPFEDGLSHGVIVNLVKMAGSPSTHLRFAQGGRTACSVLRTADRKSFEFLVLSFEFNHGLHGWHGL